MFDDDRFRDILPTIFYYVDPATLPFLCKLNKHVQAAIQANSNIQKIVISKKTDLFISKQKTRNPWKLIVRSVRTHDIQIYLELCCNRFPNTNVDAYSVLFEAVEYKYSNPIELINPRNDYFYQEHSGSMLFELALKSQNDKFIHFVLNLETFDPTYNDYSALRTALKYHNMVVFNLLVKRGNIPDEIVLNSLNDSFLYKRKAKCNTKKISEKLQIEYFDPVLRRTLHVPVKKSSILKYSKRYLSLNSESISYWNANTITPNTDPPIKIPFPVETGIINTFVSHIETGFNDVKWKFGALDDFNSFVRLISFFEIDFV